MLRPLLSLPLIWQVTVYLVGMALFLGVLFGVGGLLWERFSKKVEEVS